VTVTLARPAYSLYTFIVKKKSLLQQNPHLQSGKQYQKALRANVLSSMAIEGVRKVAEKALPAAPAKPAKA
jgi:hypothetical protein